MGTRKYRQNSDFIPQEKWQARLSAAGLRNACCLFGVGQIGLRSIIDDVAAFHNERHVFQ